MLHWSFGGFLAHARPVQGKRERKRGWLRFCHTGANSVRRCRHFQRIPGGSRILRILNGRQQCDIACLAIVLLKRRSLQNASGGTSKLAFSVKNQDLEKHKHKNIVTKDPKSTHPHLTEPLPTGAFSVLFPSQFRWTQHLHEIGLVHRPHLLFLAGPRGGNLRLHILCAHEAHG